MFTYVFIVEAIITIIYLKELFVSQRNDLFEVIIVILLYLCFKLLYYIFYETRYSKYILMLVTIGMGLAAYILFPPIAYFLALNMSQLFYEMNKKYFSVFLLLLSVVFSIPIIYIQNLSIISVFSIVFVICAYNLNAQINTLKINNEKLKKSTQKMQEDIVLAKKYDANARYQYQLEQRSLLTQKLHDELGHTLSGNTIQLEAVKLLIDRDAEKSKTLLQDVIDNLRRGMESIRGILRNTKPESSSVNIGHIKLLASETQEKSKIIINVIYNNDITAIDPKKWVIITANIREALTNLMKYSKATTCKIIFEKLNKLYKVTVIDDGQGCANIKKGLGVKGMEERMAASGGQLVLDGRNGFAIVMLFPLDSEYEGR